MHGLANQLCKALVLGDAGVSHVVRGQQAFYPFPLVKKPLLWAKAQVFVLVLPAASHALAYADFFQQVLHFGRIVTRNGQVMRTQRASQASHGGAPAVTAYAVF